MRCHKSTFPKKFLTSIKCLKGSSVDKSYLLLPTHIDPCDLSFQVRDDKIPIKKNFAKVVVHVEDCNDHIPSFLNPHYEGTISNLALTGIEVLRVKALDKDTGSNAEIVYSFHSGK